MAAERFAGALPVLHETFSEIMNAQFGGAGGSVAVGLSGGPDSIALCFLLSTWAAGPHSTGAGPRSSVHALTVDHGLRAESAQEAQQVGAWVSDWPHVVHSILRWDHAGEVVDSRIQEEARAARYALMGEYLRDHALSHLFLAHHRDDQAETVLFRLAHGSGLDGLSGMAGMQAFGDGVVLCRPLLEFSKANLVATCTHYGLHFLHDPSNDAEKFARVRLRGSMDILAREGLSAERLSVTARRLARARRALDEMAAQTLEAALIEKNSTRVVLLYDVLQSVPEEIGLRVILSVMAALVPPDPYGPRLERVEALFSDLMKPEPFRKRTLNKTVFERQDKRGHVVMSLERGAEDEKL